MAERNALGTAGAPARVENQRDVVHIGWRHALTSGRPGERHRAVRVHLDAKHRHPRARRTPRVIRAVRRQQQHARVRVLEEEAEFLFLVPRVQRRRRARFGCRKKGDDGRQTIRQRHADAIPAADAGGRKHFRKSRDLLAKMAVP